LEQGKGEGKQGKGNQRNAKGTFNRELTASQTFSTAYHSMSVSEFTPYRYNKNL
jgi:hypothetical protein